MATLIYKQPSNFGIYDSKFLSGHLNNKQRFTLKNLKRIIPSRSSRKKIGNKLLDIEKINSNTSKLYEKEMIQQNYSNALTYENSFINNNQYIIEQVPFIKNSYDEDYNEGTINVNESYKRAEWYLNSYPSKFKQQEYSAETVPIDNIFGILVNNTNTKPMVYDIWTKLFIKYVDVLPTIIDESYEPIYLLHKGGVSRIPPSDLTGKYFRFFQKMSKIYSV